MATTPSPTVIHQLDTESLPSSVAEIADLARRDAGRTPQPYPLDGNEDRSLVLVKLRQDERVEKLDLELHLPEPARSRGSVTVHEPQDFIDYTNRILNADHTTVWANVDQGTVTTLVNDHASWDRAGWRDHTVHLRLQPDEDWQKWMAGNGKLVDQATFAEFIEDVAHTVIDPDAATMFEVASTMQAKRAVDFRQGTKLQSGDVELRYEETTQARAGVQGQLEIPERITVQLAPWRGVIVANLQARLRWRINDGKLLIGYKLLRPDVFRAEVFEGLIERIRGGLDVVPLFCGAVPGSLHQ